MSGDVLFAAHRISLASLRPFPPRRTSERLTSFVEALLPRSPPTHCGDLPASWRIKAEDVVPQLMRGRGQWRGGSGGGACQGQRWGGVENDHRSSSLVVHLELGGNDIGKRRSFALLTTCQASRGPIIPTTFSEADQPEGGHDHADW